MSKNHAMIMLFHGICFTKILLHIFYTYLIYIYNICILQKHSKDLKYIGVV